MWCNSNTNGWKMHFLFLWFCKVQCVIHLKKRTHWFHTVAGNIKRWVMQHFCRFSLPPSFLFDNTNTYMTPALNFPTTSSVFSWLSFSYEYPLSHYISLNGMWEFMCEDFYTGAMSEPHSEKATAKIRPLPAALWSSLNTSGLWQKSGNKMNLTLHIVAWLPAYYNSTSIIILPC